jgi:hypothetical protein
MNTNPFMPNVAMCALFGLNFAGRAPGARYW